MVERSRPVERKSLDILDFATRGVSEHLLEGLADLKLDFTLNFDPHF